MNFGELLMANNAFGEEDPKKKKENPFGKEMRILTKKNLPFDNKSSLDLVRTSSKLSGIDPSLLLSSAFQEGMNKAIAHPDEISQSYLDNVKGDDEKNFPVDGFYNYGIDKFSEYLPKIKKYLPEGFESQYKLYPGKNEQGEMVDTAAFKTNEAALIANAAILKDAMGEVEGYAKEKGVQLDDQAKNYFTLARYNAKPENFKIMMDEYSKAKDKKSFIEKGETSRKGVHKNIYPRLENMAVANELLNPPTENPLGNEKLIKK
jgi:hypothetical protein